MGGIRTGGDLRLKKFGCIGGDGQNEDCDVMLDEFVGVQLVAIGDTTYLFFRDSTSLITLLI